MASYYDLGLVRNLDPAQFIGREQWYFLEVSSNGHLYAAQKEEDLNSLAIEKDCSIERIETIKNRFFNTSGVESANTSDASFGERKVTSDISFLDFLEDVSQEVSEQSHQVSCLRESSVGFPSKEKIEEIFQNTTHITRSRNGTEGVYFLKNTCAPNNQLVLKCYCEEKRAMSEVVADRFFRFFGFITPQYYFIPPESNLWALAKSKLPLARKSLENEKQAIRPKQNRELQECEKRLKKLHSFLESTKFDMTIMNDLPGKPFAELTTTDIQQIYDENVLMALGAMIFLDAFIGNVDRLRENDINAGNFFLLNKKQYESNQKSIVLLDHGCYFDFSMPKNLLLNRIKKDIDQLWGEKGQKLLKSIMTTFFQTLWNECFNSSNSEAMQHGVHAAATDLVSQFDNQEQNVDHIFTGLNEEDRKQYKSLFIELVNHVKKKLNS